MLTKKAELLAPVGNIESLSAAIENGADAVYLGGKLFNARQSASNFDYEELKSAVEYAHLKNTKVYITVNILTDDREMRKTLDYVRYLYEIDVDAIIVQDVGLAYMVNKIFPDFELHGSTQMTINNLQGAIFLKKLGFKRVVLARETPLEEIKNIYDSTDIELEAFVHGALCVSYSGQCLMSSMIGGRSGNRGRCAQPCRMPYSIVDYNNGEVLFDEWRNKYLLSPKDLNTLEDIESIVNNGVISLKIEGRMKRPEYVATVVKNYRKALDLGYDSITEKNREDVLQIFNRGFTKGVMLDDFGRDLMSYQRPDNRGVVSGEFLEEARRSYEIDKIKNPIDMEVNISINNPAGLIIYYKDKIFKIESDYIVEKAEKISLTKERVMKQLSKLNDTVYSIDNIKINLEEGSFMPIGAINGLRREGIAKLDNAYKNFNKRTSISDKEYKRRCSKFFKFIKSENKIKNKISVKVIQKEHFDQLDLNRLDRIYIGFDEDLKDSVLKAKDQGKEVYLSTDKILYREGLEKLKKNIKSIKDIIDGVSVSNLGTLQFMKDNFNLNLHGDIGLNVFNSFSVNALKDEGLKSITLSPELNIRQIKGIVNKEVLNHETIGYGYLPLMVMRHCPMSLVKNCKDDSNCATCSFSKGYGLKDRKGINFYMERNRNNITTIYNSVPIMIVDSLPKLYTNGVNMVRLDFTFEQENINQLQRIYYDVAKGKVSRDEIDEYVKEYRSKKNITKGHYFRGVI